MADEKLNPNEFAVGEDEWVLVDEVQATMSPNHDRLLIRRIDGIDSTYLNLAIADLRQRTSTKNERGKTCNWVDTPRVGQKGPAAQGREYPGIWRGVSVRGSMKGGTTSIIQTLAYGLIRSGTDTLPTPELVATADRLIQPHAIEGTPSITQKEVRYRGFDPSYVETAKATFSLTAGVISVRSVRMQDGSYNIHVLTETPSWAAFNVATPDTTSKANYGTDFEEHLQTWHGISNTDVLTNVYVTTTSGYRINDVTIDDQLDGSVKVVRVLVKAATFATASPDHVWYENKTRNCELMHEEWYGVAETDPLTDLWTDPVGYRIISARPGVAKNGTMTVERVSVLAKTFATASPDLTWYENKTRNCEVMHEEWYYLDKTDACTDLHTDPSGRRIIDAQKIPTDNCLMTVHRTSIVSRTFATGSPDLTWYENFNKYCELKHEEWYYLDKTDACTDLWTNPSGRVTIDAQKSPAENCLMTVHRISVDERTFVAASPDLVWYEDKDRKHEVMHELWFWLGQSDALTDAWTDPGSGAYSVKDVVKREQANALMTVERISAMKNTWYTAVLSAGDADAIGTNAFVYTQAGVTAGFRNKTYVAYHIPIADVDDVLAALLIGTGIKEWVTGTTYSTGDMRSSGGLCYIANQGFTSGADLSADIALGYWDRISEARQGDTDGNVSTIVFDTQPALEYGYFAQDDAETGQQPGMDVYVWTNVDPARFSAVWTVAADYKGESGTLIHKRATKSFDNRGIATITAEAWTVNNTDNDTFWGTQGVTDNQGNDIEDRVSEWNDDGEWRYRSYLYSTKYHTTEKLAYDEIDDEVAGVRALEGSNVTHVSSKTWRSMKVTKIVYTEWYPGPVNTTTVPPTSIKP